MSINFKALAKEQETYVIELRRDFHMHPEVAGQEVRTSARICEELGRMGVPCERVNELNVVGKIDTGRPGKAVAIRADIDALPMQEQNDVPYRSTVDGKMHACGHDAHAAILLGTARALQRMREELSGVVYLCFQIGEEIGKGAAEVVQYLKDQGGVDRVFALHVGAQIEKGHMFLPEREMMAGVAAWNLTIHGRGGHGSQPYTAIDPIKPIMEILQRVTSLAVNRIDPFENFVVSPCMLQSGTAPNIIPATAFAAGTVRFFSMQVCEDVKRMMREIADDIAHSYGATAELVFGGGGLPTLNDPEAVKVGRRAAEETGLALVDRRPSMGSDNYAQFANAFSGFYCDLGCGNSARGLNEPNHSPRFDLDESAFVDGVEFFLRCTEGFLGEG